MKIKLESSLLAAVPSVLFVVSLASCDRSVGDFPPLSHGQGGGPATFVPVEGEAGAPPLNVGPYEVWEDKAFPLAEPDGGIAEPLDETYCPAQEVVVGAAVRLRELSGLVTPHNTLTSYRYPVWIAARCAKVNDDGTLGEAHTLRALTIGIDETSPVQRFDCPEGSAAVSLRGSFDADPAYAGRWLSSVGFECHNLQAWLLGNTWTTEAFHLGTPSQEFAHQCTEGAAVIKGFGARADSSFFRQLTSKCVVVSFKNR